MFKDTTNWQTNYYLPCGHTNLDNCKCMTTNRERWRERFDEKFWDWTLWSEEIAEFLEAELANARREWSEEMKQKIEKGLDEHVKEMEDKIDNFSCWDEYQDALGTFYYIISQS